MMTVATTTAKPSIPGAALVLIPRAIPEARASFKKPAHRFDVQDEQILEYLPFVKAIVSSMRASLPSHVDRDDLIQAGAMGLMDAFRKFDAAKGVGFACYAKFRIRGAILDSLRNQDHASRDLRRTQKKFQVAAADLTAKLLRTPTEEEIADEVGMELKTFRRKMFFVNNLGLLSASTRLDKEDDLPVPELPAKIEDHPDNICSRKERQFVANEVVKVLPPRYQLVIRLYYNDEMTMKEIGCRLGINESRVSQIHKAALQRMAEELQANSISCSRDV